MLQVLDSCTNRPMDKQVWTQTKPVGNQEGINMEKTWCDLWYHISLNIAVQVHKYKNTIREDWDVWLFNV